LREKEHFTIKTIKQAKRLIKVVVGFTVLLLGLIMLVTPGPGIVTIILGLAILGTEFVWAKRLMKRLKKRPTMLKTHLLTII